LTSWGNQTLQEIVAVDAERRREVERGRLAEASYLELRREYVAGGWLPELEAGEVGAGGDGEGEGGDEADAWTMG
jgi:hypothetical protein